MGAAGVNQGYGTYDDSDNEGEDKADDSTENAFSDKAVRQGFIRKVYGILTIQLLMTFGIIMLFVHVEKIRDYVKTHSWMYWTGFATTLTCMIAMSCCDAIRPGFILVQCICAVV